MIHIDGIAVLDTLDRRGWRKGSYGNDRPDGKVCLYGAIRICAPIPGDAYLVEQVKAREGHGTGWNDDTTTTEADVRAWINGGIDVTDIELAETYGPAMTAAEDLARTFHEAYERLAPHFGYETRDVSAVPWDEVPEPNRSLMVAVCSEVLDRYSPPPPRTRRERPR